MFYKVLLNFRNVEKKIDDNPKFLVRWCYVIKIVIFFVILTFTVKTVKSNKNEEVVAVFILLETLAIIFLLFLIFNCIKVVQMSRSSDFTQNFKFGIVKKR